MRFYILMACSLLATNASALEHGAGISVIQQKQEFDIEGKPLKLTFHTPSFQYSLSAGPWSVSLSINEGETDDFNISSDEPLRYTLRHKHESLQGFIDYNFENTWITTGYLSTEQSHSYWASDDTVRTFATSQLKVKSLLIESGYAWSFESSQVLTSLGLTYQDIEDSYNSLRGPTNNFSANQVDNGEVSEKASLADVGISYQHYLSVNKKIDLLLGIALQHSESISGSAQISQTSQIRLAGNNLLPQENSSLVESASSSTSIALQSGLIMDYGSINFSANKLTSEKWDDALMELGITLYY